MFEYAIMVLEGEKRLLKRKELTHDIMGNKITEKWKKGKELKKAIEVLKKEEGDG